MTKTSKIAISLPEELLTAVERERAESGESRSQLFRRAVDLLLGQRKEREMSDQYILAYKEWPETTEEVAASKRSARAILPKEPW